MNEDPWAPRRMPRCTGRHGPWITYQSYKTRMCHACDYTEPMYSADHVFDKDPSVPLASEVDVRAARNADRIATLNAEIEALLAEDETYE